MKIEVDRDVLADAVGWAARVLPSRAPSSPLLVGLLLQAEGESLTLSGYDYDVSAQQSVAAIVHKPGKVLISGHLLADIARLLPKKPVVLSVEDQRVEVTCGRSSFVLPTLPVEQYPELPPMPEPSGVVSGVEFAQALTQVAIAAGRDNSLPMLTGIRVEVKQDQITLVATDRYRLALRRLQWQPQDQSIETQGLVLARTLTETAKALGHTKEVSLSFPESADGLIGFEADGRTTTTRQLDGDFVPYQKLFPEDTPTSASVETDALLEAVKRVSLVAERNTPVRLSFREQEVELQAGTGEEAQAREVIEGELTGEPIEIAFNPQYLLDGLNSLETPGARFMFTTALRAAIMHPVAEIGAPADKSYSYLLMPVRVS